ncbi:MAG: hypothetical protein IT435_17465 [Phycisphaerales bacterium]|nr:hypothetical protein [Phycisphaerales bacterium]
MKSPSRSWGSSSVCIAAVSLAAAAGAALFSASCSAPSQGLKNAVALQEPVAPEIMQPTNAEYAKPGAPRKPGDEIDLTTPGAVVWKTAPAVIEDMSLIPQQMQVTEPWRGPQMAVRDITGHKKTRPPIAQGEPNNLPLGGIDVNGTKGSGGGAQFPGISATTWTPPDPTLAAGPNHILATVNMAIAWWTKTGTLQFSSNLDNTGNPGFFESVGCGNFTFDPKCFYDHYAGRWVVIAPETYGSTQAWICIAVSDDSDPNGTWYKYRTDAVLTVSGSTYWWDYPGFGYDQHAYYVTGNLFKLAGGGSGTAGTGYRIFHKAPLLTGQTAVYSTVRDGSIFSVQVAQCFGNPNAPFFTAVNSSSSIRVQAITNPLTSPAIVTTNVTVPSSSGTGSAPSAGGNSVGMIDGRILNAHWRNGNLYATHDSNSGGVNVARWYQFNTGNWPTSGSVTLAQSGNIAPGGGKATFFPAIYSNVFNDVAVVVGASSVNERISVNYAARRATDPSGTMGPLTQLRMSGANGGGRWGDYQDIAVDPTDDSTFWVVGETAEASGWSTWIDKFTVTTAAGPFATDDSAGNVFEDNPVTLDVLANDGHTSGQPIVISTFDAASVHGGTVTRSVGTGPGGRDQLIYDPPNAYVGPDSFTYTVKDPANVTDVGTVTANVLNDSAFRDPENPANTEPGLDVGWYSFTSNQSSMPNYASMSPYLTTTVTQLNQGSTLFQFMNSTRSDRVGGSFTGYIDIPATDFYDFYLESDDGSKLYFGNTLFIDHDGVHGFTEKTGNIGLKAGKHAIKVEYFENTSSAGLRLWYASSAITKVVVPVSAYSNPGSCPADFDGSGFVDIEDYSAFVVAFEAGDESADFDNSGFVDTDDFDAFVEAFELGC